MKKLIAPLLLSFILFLPIFGMAQQANLADVPDRADVMKFLDLMHVREQMQVTMRGLENQMREGAEAGFKQKVPNATPEQLAKVDQVFEGIFTSLPMDELVDAIVPIYQKHLTKTDLAAVVAFYSSPAGQKILRELPAILSESMQAGGEIGRRLISAKSTELDKRLAELVQDSTKPGSTTPPK